MHCAHFIVPFLNIQFNWKHLYYHDDKMYCSWGIEYRIVIIININEHYLPNKSDFYFYVCSLVGIILWLSVFGMASSEIHQHIQYILHITITRYTLFVWKKDKLLKNCFRDSLKESEKLTKQRISNKQNFTHLSATCDWNNFLLSSHEYLQLWHDSPWCSLWPFTGLVNWPSCCGAKEFCCIFRFINKFVPNNFWMQN